MSNSSTPLSFAVLTAFVVRDDAGALDFDATMKKFASRITEYEAAVSMESDQIGAAVHAVFDKYPGLSIPMDAVVNFALPDLNPTPDNHAILKERVKQYIRDNADHPEIKDEETKAVITAAEPDRTRDFAINKGKGGGVKRWADHAEKPVSA